MRIGKNFFRLMVVCFSALGIAGWAMASNLAIYPVRVVLDERNPAGEITLRNDDQSPKVVQVELLRWTQQEGKEVYAPTRDLLVNPPVFTINAGQSQLIRVGINHSPNGTVETVETAYRLYVQEVPPPPRPGFSGLQMALRIGVPIFVNPQGTANPGLRWKAARSNAGAIRLVVTNVGNVHVELLDFRLTEPVNAGRVISWGRTPFYLLPGQSRDLILRPEFDWKGHRFNLSANTDRGLVEAALALETEKP